MKWTVILLVVVGCAAPPKRNQFDDDWNYRPDSRAAHIGITAAITFASYLILNRIFPRLENWVKTSLAVSVAVGGMNVKEFAWDETASLSDYKANWIGGASAGVILLLSSLGSQPLPCYFSDYDAFRGKYLENLTLDPSVVRQCNSGFQRSNH